MRAYEITNVLVDSPAVVEEAKKQIREILSKYSVEITHEEDWGSKTLYHKIQGNTSGFYTYLECKAKPEVIKSLEHEFHLNQNILRSLIVKKEKK